MKSLYEFLTEKSQSKSQQSLMTVALQVREGDMKIGDIKNNNFKEKVKEIVEGKLSNKELRKFAETETKDLPQKVDERKTIQVKRKYAKYDSISVGANAPIRNNILGFISEKGYCTRKELSNFIATKNEEDGCKTSKSWIYKNKKYLVEYNKDGVDYYKLSNLGKRVMNKTIINEN